MIENPFYSPEFHGEDDLVSIGCLDLEERGSIAARIETTGGKQERR